MNGSSLLLYIDDDRLLFSKSHSFSFDGDMVDVSTKVPTASIVGESYYWETANLNWEVADLYWDDIIYDSSLSGWSESMVGYRSSKFSAEGLLSLNKVFQSWDTTDYYWQLFDVNWEDGAIDPNPSTSLDDLIITGEEVKFQILDINMNSVFVGRCKVSSYELVANNEGAMFFNADFSVTGVVS